MPLTDVLNAMTRRKVFSDEEKTETKLKVRLNNNSSVSFSKRVNLAEHMKRERWDSLISLRSESARPSELGSTSFLDKSAEKPLARPLSSPL